MSTLDGYTPLDPRFVPLQRLVGRITAVVLSLLALVGLIVALTPRRWLWIAVIWLTVTVAFAWLLDRWPAVAYRYAGYRIDERGIELRSGVYWQQVVNVPRSRVQHTDVAQGPLERRFGLGTLIIYTAGTDHSRVDQPGLEHGVALALRDHLLPRETTDVV